MGSDSTNVDAKHNRTAIESWLERPVAEIANFCGQFVVTWVRGLVDPWGLGCSITQRSPEFRTPFAFLVISLFFTGVTIRLGRALAASQRGADASLVDDVRVALESVSLPQIMLVTLPCVLIVAGVATAIRRVWRRGVSSCGDAIVAGACYAVGWQAIAAALVAIWGIVLCASGNDPASYFRNDLLNVLAVATFAWGTLIFTPALYGSIANPRWWSRIGCWGIGIVLPATLVIGSLLVLDKSMNFSEAKTRGLQRQFADLQREVNSWIGPLQIDMLRSRPVPSPVAGDSQCMVLTVAYTSRASELLIVPRQELLQPMKHPKLTEQAAPLRVISSSLDFIPDRALMVAPGQTRVAEYVVEPLAASDDNREFGTAPYAVQFHRLGREGAFYDGHAMLIPTREVAAGPTHTSRR